MKVSIIMLTYNAPVYIEHSIRSVYENTVDIDFELIVCDNCSNEKTKRKLNSLYSKGHIDKLIFFDKNYFFVGGNNKAVKYADEESEFLLLLNSDIEIKNKQWLKKILDVHKRGITACQICDEEDCRPDGWCLLVDKDIYSSHKLDEKRFIWYYSIADFGSRVMKSGFNVQTIRNYNNFIKHFGGASEINSEVQNIGCEYINDVNNWYPHKCRVIDHLDVISKYEVKKNFKFALINYINKLMKKFKKISLKHK